MELFNLFTKVLLVKVCHFFALFDVEKLFEAKAD